MGRPFRRRLLVNGTLAARTPIHVGAGGDESDIDLLLVRDGAGDPVVPGTSLAGALRAWLGPALDDTVVDRVFGFEKDRNTAGAASRLHVEDGEVHTGHQDVAMHTAIDRWSGTAYTGTLHSREVLPRGSTIDIELELESTGPEDEAALGLMLKALRKGTIAVGAAKTRGLGEVTLTRCAITEESWSTRDEVLKTLAGDTTNPTIDDLVGRARHAQREQRLLDIEIEWKPLLPVMVSEPGGEIDISARVDTTEDRVYLSLPGSALKGALRSRAEFIVRTLSGETLTGRGEPQGQSEQIDLALVRDLFGQVLRHPTAETPGTGRIGAVRVSSIRSKTSVDRSEWESLANMTKANLKNESQPMLREILRTTNRSLCVRDHTAPNSECADGHHAPGAQLDVATHVAIDRFSGGAADTALFSAIEPHGFIWEPVRLRVDLSRLGDHPRSSLALLLTTLAELCEGWVPLGFGSNRGYGSIEVRSVRFTPAEVDLDDRRIHVSLSREADGRWVPGSTELLSGWFAETENDPDPNPEEGQ